MFYWDRLELIYEVCLMANVVLKDFYEDIFEQKTKWFLWPPWKRRYMYLKISSFNKINVSYAVFYLPVFFGVFHWCRPRNTAREFS